MKVLFIADLHIKVGQKNVPRQWAIDRCRTMFMEFSRVKREYAIDLEIHGGDIFDKMPNLTELSLYLEYVATAGNLCIFDGNHEASKKGETFLELLRGVLAGVNKECKLITEYHTATEEIPFDILPYCQLKKFEKSKVYPKDRKALLTHVRGEIPPHVKAEVDLDIFKGWDVVFAGDLHSHSNTQKNIVYPGSPITVSFHRKEVDTGVIVIDTEDMSWEWVNLEVPQLIRKRVSSEAEIVSTEYNHTIYELEGDAVDLMGVSSEFLDKKIIKSAEEATLNLKGLSFRDEVHLYLEEVVDLDKNKVTKCMRYLDDYIM